MKGVKLKNKFINILIMSFIFGLTYIDMAFSLDADKLFYKGRYDEALEAYQKGDLENPRDYRYRYNKGVSAYKKSDYEKSALAFSSILKRAKDKEIQFRSLFNLGNIAFKNKDFKNAISFFKKAVILKPGDRDARYNLELSLRELKKSKSDKKDSENKKPGKKKREEPEQKDSNKSADNKNPENNEPQADKNKEQGQKKEPGNDESQKNGGKAKDSPKTPLSFDKRKANALLDNIKENRLRYFQFKFGGKKEKEGKSGRNW